MREEDCWIYTQNVACCMCVMWSCVEFIVFRPLEGLACVCVCLGRMYLVSVSVCIYCVYVYNCILYTEFAYFTHICISRFRFVADYMRVNVKLLLVQIYYNRYKQQLVRITRMSLYTTLIRLFDLNLPMYMGGRTQQSGDNFQEKTSQEHLCGEHNTRT